MTAQFVTDQTRLLSRLAHDADQLAAKAQKWIDDFATREAEAAAASEAFALDFSPESAAELALAKNRVRDFGHAAEAVIAAGGPSEARARALRSPAVYSALAKGFAEKISTLSKLVPVALKRLGERRLALTELGTPAGIIETDALVCALRVYHDALVANIAVAEYGRVFSTDRGVGRQPRTFDDLFGCLTAPIPQPPAA